MSEGGDWFADSEGNLTGPGGAEPATDEFGRDDPASVERERRRREREERRGKSEAKRRGSADGAAPRPPEAKDGAAGPPRTSVAERAAARRDALRRRIEGRPGGGRAAGRGPRGANYRRRQLVALGLALVGILVAWFLVALFQPFAGEGEGQVVVTIPEGASADEVSQILAENDVISNETLFKLRLRLAGESDSIQASRYVLAREMSYAAAIDALTGGATGGRTVVTVPEGDPREVIADRLAELGIEGDYVAATKLSQGFDPARYGARNPPHLEGFLFPATYELEPGSSVNELIAQQLAAFKQNLASVDLSYAKSKNLTPYDVLIIASMIDREVQVPRERPLVAAVIYNRLSRGQPLGIDATTRYEHDNYTEPLTNEELLADTPYNTRTNQGLPPTPIGNPGLAAIRAAAKPAKVNYLYYVVRPGGSGEHTFTASAAEFEQLAEEYQRALEAEGGSPTE